MMPNFPTVVEPESHRGGTGVPPWWNWSVIAVAQTKRGACHSERHTPLDESSL